MASTRNAARHRERARSSDRCVGVYGARRARQSAQSGWPADHLVRRWRAGLSDARADQSRPPTGPWLDDATHYTTVSGDPALRKLVADRTAEDHGRALHVEPGHRHQRRQGSAVHRHAGAVRPGRRSAAAGALLGQLRRAGQDGRCQRSCRSTTRRQHWKLTPDDLRAPPHAAQPRAGAVYAAATRPAPSTATPSSRRSPTCSPSTTWPSSSTRSTPASATCRSAAGCAPRRSLADRSLIVDGVSKAYAMTGWRLGWLRRPARPDGDGVGAAEPSDQPPVVDHPARGHVRAGVTTGGRDAPSTRWSASSDSVATRL